MLKWTRVIALYSKRIKSKQSSTKIKRELEAYRKWSQRKTSDRLSN